MTIIEKKSERKKKAIMALVSSGEYSIAYALMLAEELNDTGKLLDADYEELAEYLESLLIPVEETEIPGGEDANIEENASYNEQDAEVQPTDANTAETEA